MYARQKLTLYFALFGAASLGAACGRGNGGDGGGDGGPAATSVTQPAAGGPQTPDPGGKVIVVEMMTDAEGNNKFSPNDFEAHVGDVIRFTLVQGVHNAQFVADSSPGVQGLPAAGQLLQVPGQTDDVKVTWAPGRYFFQCDPHALLGMIGHVRVEGGE
jgi:plastocyanin